MLLVYKIRIDFNWSIFDLFKVGSAGGFGSIGVVAVSRGDVFCEWGVDFEVGKFGSEYD